LELGTILYLEIRAYEPISIRSWIKMIMTKGITGKFLSKTRKTIIAREKILSITGSRIFPNGVIWCKTLARNPSRTSVIPQKRIKINAQIFSPLLSSISIKGKIRRRKVVIRLGMVAKDFTSKSA
jgi:hypothetical protein